MEGFSNDGVVAIALFHECHGVGVETIRGELRLLEQARILEGLDCAELHAVVGAPYAVDGVSVLRNQVFRVLVSELRVPVRRL